MSEVKVTVKDQVTPVFSKRKIERNRVLTPFYKYGINEDRYGNESYFYDETPTYNIMLMWLPISSQADIEQYGERVNEMMQACLFSNEEVSEHDRLEIAGNMFNLVSIKKYPNYRLLLAERVR